MSTTAQPNQAPSVKSPTELHAKVAIQDFEKIRLIGKGDVGRVYLVLHKPTEKLYAMKVLHKDEMIKRNKVWIRSTCSYRKHRN